VQLLRRHLRPLAEEAAIIRRMIEAWLERYGDRVDDAVGRLKVFTILLSTSSVCEVACCLLHDLNSVLVSRLCFWVSFVENDVPDTCRLAARVAQVILKPPQCCQYERQGVNLRNCRCNCEDRRTSSLNTWKFWSGT
jgi:hypothetical protein